MGLELMKSPTHLFKSWPIKTVSSSTTTLLHQQSTQRLCSWISLSLTEFQRKSWRYFTSSTVRFSLLALTPFTTPPLPCKLNSRFFTFREFFIRSLSICDALVLLLLKSSPLKFSFMTVCSWILFIVICASL